MRLMGLSFKVYHRPGATLGHADAVSRPPMDQVQTTNLESVQAVNPMDFDSLIESQERSPILFQDGALTENFKSSPSAASIDLVSFIDDESPLFKEREIFEAQQKDEFCRLYREYRRIDPRERNHQRFKLIWPYISKLNIFETGIVGVSTSNKLTFRVVLPLSLRNRVFQHYHANIIVGGHLGYNKTYNKIKKSYFWCGMAKDIEQKCHSCATCLIHAPRHPSIHGFLHPISAFRPWDIVGMDVAGPISPTSGDFKYILVCVDYFTRWCEAIPLAVNNAKSVANAFLTKIIARHGIPKKVITDEGGSVDSSQIRELTHYFGIEKQRSVAYKPSTDGMAERVIGTLKKMLAKYCSERGEKWHKFLPLVLMSYHASIHSATGYSPYYLMFGRNPNFSPGHLDGWPFELLSDDASLKFREMITLYAKNLTGELWLAHAEAQSHIRDYQLSVKKSFDKDRLEAHIVPGDWVWKLRAPHLIKARVFESHRCGPYRVTKVSENGVVDIIHPVFTENTYRTNISLLEKLSVSIDELDLEFDRVPLLPRGSAIRILQIFQLVSELVVII